MKTINFSIVIFIIISLVSCQKEDLKNEELVYKKDLISGHIQKGPFINGTSVMVSELNSALGPTGRVFNTQIVDNSGSFELRDIILNSNFVELIANGYYFNENSGDISSSQLTLHALSDLTDSSTINVNILTELEKDRVKHLVAMGNDFLSSKIQAQNEILRIFSISKSDLRSSEYLDISKSGEDNAILLATSIIMQGYRTEAELSEFIAAISTDVKEDGILNNQQLGTQLISDISRINISEVRNHIVSRFSNLDTTYSISDFEKYINEFINNSDFELTSGIVYPDEGKYGSNLLSADGGDYTEYADDKLSITAELAKGTSLKVIIYPDFLNDTTIYDEPKYYFHPAHYSSYGIGLFDNSGWGYNNDSYQIDQSIILFNSESGRKIEGQFKFYSYGGARIEIYENNQITPTRTKIVKW